MKLITAPTADVVTLADMKAYLRVDYDDEDALIAQLIAAAVAYLDGWGGILGRCIMPQTWAFDATAGDVESPMPDVTAATQGGDALAVDGDVITVPVEGEVRITCALPERYLPKVRGAVMMMVADWYDNRAPSDMPAAAMAIVASMRWNQA